MEHCSLTHDFFDLDLRVFAGTWNVAQGKASMQSLQAWLAGPAKHAGLIFVGLQEMEMGAGAIGMAAVKETVSPNLCLCVWK